MVGPRNQSAPQTWVVDISDFSGEHPLGPDHEPMSDSKFPDIEMLTEDQAVLEIELVEQGKYPQPSEERGLLWRVVRSICIDKHSYQLNTRIAASICQ